ncbi:MAG: hypothetical protein S0880_00615 [Actinomycetota bacterium]|nr:hypothetical protein [Actinomycetota bacterium]
MSASLIRPARASRALVVGVVGLALFAGACGDAQEPPGQLEGVGQRFDPLTFDDVPRPANAEAVSSSSEGGIEHAELEIGGTSPELVIDWYSNRLGELGWEPSVEVAEQIDGDLYGTWVKDNRTLVVVASPGEEEDDGTTGPVPLSLTLGPAGSGAPVIPVDEA